MKSTPLRLEGQVALITGAAGGLGTAIAARLSDEGAALVLCDLDADRAAAAGSLLGTEVLSLACDVTNATQVQAMVHGVLARFGRLDILVNNAGILRDNLLFRMEESDWDEVMAVHLRGAFLCSRAAQKPMVTQRSGRIISLSSLSALGNRGQANYAAAKAGLQGFTRTLSLELGPFGITVNAVAPGFIDAGMTRLMAERLGTTVDALKEQMSPQIALRRWGQPEEVASVVAFLASHDASYVSGQTIYITGGPVGVLM
jgi:3-oxoacyl-[acyl-carrier protein] reductase